MSQAPVLYLDYMSQPCRACAIFVACNKLPVEVKKVFIHKGETKSKEYRAINPLGKVPVMVDGSLTLPESAAILVYLAEKYDVPEHWCPRRDPAAKAHHNAAMHWYHTTVRAGCARVVIHSVLGPRLGVTVRPEVYQEGRDILRTALPQLERYWLQGGQRRFMTSDEVSLADVLCCCEFEQMTMMDKDKHGTDLQDLLSKYPAAQRWMDDVKAACGPAYEDAHKILRNAAAAGRPKL